MVRFLKIFSTLLVVSLLAIGLYYYFNTNNIKSDTKDDKTNIENIVKNETNSNENIEGTVVAKRSTENSN